MKVHLVLGSGGMKTLGYAGVLATLAENDVSYASVSACSAGTFFGACIAAGVTPERLVKSVLQTDLRRYVGEPSGRGLLDRVRRKLGMFHWPRAQFTTAGMAALFCELTEDDPTFEDLKIPFSTIAVDMISARLLVYAKDTTPQMKVSEAVSIATAVPFLYPPHTTPERVVVDGALASQCPVWLAMQHADELPIISVIPRRSLRHPRNQGLGEFISSLVGLGGSSRDLYLLQQMRRAVLIEVDAADVSYDAFDMPTETRGMLIAAGRQAAERSLAALTLAAEASSAEASSAPAPPSLHTTADHDAMAESGAAHAMARANSLLSREVRDQIFISYAREDRDWVDRFQLVLKATLRNKPVTVWDDSQIGVGEAWRRAIERALRCAKVALLLVTNAFLASDFIQDVELKEILDAARMDGLLIVWVLVRPCAWEHTQLEALNCANDTRYPLNALDEADLDEAMLIVARQVRLALA